MASAEPAFSESIADLVSRVRQAKLPPAPRRRRIREAAGLSMREVARALNVDVMTVSRWEGGVRPRAEHAVAYRELLDALEEIES